MNDSDFYIPQYLDEPERFLLWTIDEALVLFLPLLIGMFCNHAIFGLSLGIVSLIALKKFKNKVGLFSYRRWIYWYLPSIFSQVKGTPPSVNREYVG